MKNSLRLIFLCAGLLLLPWAAQATPGKVNIDVETQIIAFFELVLFVTSLISIKQFFLPGLHNRTPFQIFNILFVIVFYVAALRFMVNHKGYYEGFGTLSDKDVIRKYFLSTEPLVLVKRLILVAFLLNIIYVIRHGRGYFIDKE